MCNVTQEGTGGKNVFCAIDLHQRTMLAGIAVDRGPVTFVSLDTDDDGGVAELMGRLHDLSGAHPGSRVLVSYEASGCGFRLADMMEAEGFEESVLSPSHLPVTHKKRSFKTDKNDVIRILDVLRAHVLAGNDLPSVWKPSPELRDDREIVRRRLDLKERAADVKNKIHGLLRRHGVKHPEEFKSYWTKKHLLWLGLVAGELDYGAGCVLLSMLRELKFYLDEASRMDRELFELAGEDRYRERVAALTGIKGVGTLTAMVFLTELGDLSRFGNRRELSSYLGLVPRSYESGEHDDRKGHISRMGPARVRKVLNQSAWAVVRYNQADGDWFRERTEGSNKTRKRKMVVAMMRRLGVRLWHTALAA